MSFSTVMSLIRPAFVVLGLLIAVAGTVSMVNAHRRRRAWRTSTGTVVASRLDGDGHIRLQVAFENDGREVRFWNRFTSAGGIDQVGRSVELLINPRDPSDAVITRGAANAQRVGPVFIAVGVAAVLIGLFAPA